jgi:hypothetical protein
LFALRGVVLAGFGRLLLDAFGLASGSVRALIGGHATHSAISVPISWQ